MKTQLLRLRIIGVIFIYLLAAIFTLIDKLEFIDKWDLGVNQEFWGSNGQFLAAVAFWCNLFLYSILPALIAQFSIKDKVAIYCSYVLPLFWAFFLFRSVIDTGLESEVLVPDLKYFVYGLLIVSATVILIKLILIVRSLRTEKTIEDLEKFKRHALKKLAKVNPNINQRLFADLLGNHGTALNLLMAATVEEDQEKQFYLMRTALTYVSTEEESIEKIQKRLTMYATFHKDQEMM